MKKIVLMSYASGAYVIDLSSLVYMVGFLVNRWRNKGNGSFE